MVECALASHGFVGASPGLCGVWLFLLYASDAAGGLVCGCLGGRQTSEQEEHISESVDRR